jgi:hypothetical protein
MSKRVCISQLVLYSPGKYHLLSFSSGAVFTCFLVLFLLLFVFIFSIGSKVDLGIWADG